MIDLHCHLLPGVDDGPEELDESVELCRLAAADGCEALVATPHQRHPLWWNGDRELLESRLTTVQERLGPKPRLLAGAEIHVDSIQVLEEIQKLPGGSLLSLAGSRYLLLELSRQEDWGPDPAELIHELVVTGWTPVLAHPEMYPWLAGRSDLIAHWIELGALTQVTAMSVTGDFGLRPRQMTHLLLDQGLVHFVASDSHGSRRRPPGLSAAFRTIAERWGDETANALIVSNPQAVIDNLPIPGPAATTPSLRQPAIQ
jgi:protein-tyrosine phosphatase